MKKDLESARKRVTSAQGQTVAQRQQRGASANATGKKQNGKRTKEEKVVRRQGVKGVRPSSTSRVNNFLTAQPRAHVSSQSQRGDKPPIHRMPRTALSLLRPLRPRALIAPQNGASRKNKREKTFKKAPTFPINMYHAEGEGTDSTRFW